MSDDPNYAPGAGPSAGGPDTSQQPGTPPANQPQHEIYDPPIEHDPIGQALVGLPVAALTGIGEGIADGFGMLADVGKEVIAWGAGELGIGAGESLLEPASGGETGGGAGGSSSGGDQDAGTGGGGDPLDAGTYDDPSQDEQAD